MQGDTHSFLVRVWHEAVDAHGNATGWRGSIEQVGDQQRTYFVDLGQIVHYIEQRTGLEHRGSVRRENGKGSPD